MAERTWCPAPGPVRTLHPILEQIEDHATKTGLSTSVFAAAKDVFDKALAMPMEGEVEIIGLGLPGASNPLTPAHPYRRSSWKKSSMTFSSPARVTSS